MVIPSATTEQQNKAKINLECWRLDLNKLRDPEMSQKYHNDLQTRLEVERQENERQDTPWKSIAKAFKETARDAVGFQRI